MTYEKFLRLKVLAGISSALVLSFPQVCFAQDGETHADNAESGDHWTVGAGVFGVSSPYDQDSGTTGWFPYVAYQNDWLSIDPTGVAVKALSKDQCSLELLAAPRFMLAEPAEIERYADMDRDIGLDLGARAGCDFGGGFRSSVAYKADVIDESNGHEIDVSLSKNFQLTKGIGLDLKAGTYWRDDDLSQFLYGVYSDEVRPGRPSYAPGDTFVPYAGVTSTFRITDNLTLAASFEMEVYTKAIKRSPIIDTEAAGTGFLALFFHF